MQPLKSTRRFIALLLAFVLTLPLIPTGSAQAAEPPAQAETPIVTEAFDYFKRVYPSLSQTDHVFETVTSHELSTLLDSEGTYLVLIGGAWSEATQAQIAEINAQAKAYGVEKIYNFDTRLDGKNIDITNEAGDNRDKKLYVELVNKYLLNLPDIQDKVTYLEGETTVEAKKITAPFLFAYEKGRTVESEAAPIIASASSNWNQVLDAISIETNGQKVAQHDIFTAEDYFTKVYDDKLDREIFRGKEVVFEHVTYHELQELLKTEGTHNIVIGGSWCPNTQPVIGLINDAALDKGITKIYNFDTKLDGGVYGTGGNDFQIRTTDHRYANLYVDLVNENLPNLTTYNAGQNPPTRISYQANGETVSATRLQIPYPFIYDKAAVNAQGQPAPILGHVELMYTWTNIVEGHQSGNRARYQQALDLLYSRLELSPSGLAGVAPSYIGSTNGRITGTTTALEYKLANSETYTRATNEQVTDLAPGTYHVRYAAKTGYNAGATNPTDLYYSAGPAVEVVVPASTTNPPTSGPTPTTPPPTTPVDEEEETETPGEETPGTTPPTSVTVEVTVDEETGYAVAAATAESVEALIATAKLVEAAGEQAVVEFNVNPGSAATVQLTIPRAAFNALASGTDAAIKLAYGNLGTLLLDANAVQSISAAAGDGDISFIIGKSSLTEEGQEALGDRPVYDISVFAGETPIETFAGSTIHVSLPYTLAAGESPEAIIVYAVSAEGDLETLRGRYVAGTRTVDFDTTHFSQFIIGYNPVVFADVASSAWHAQAISFLAARGITNGTDADHYSPSAQVTRGQFIVLLLNSYGITPQAGATDNFADAGNKYYTDYLAAAKQYGIAQGSGDNRFAPEDAITRQELFTLLYRALDTLGELPEAAAGAATDSYSDADQIAPYAREAFDALVARGIVQGNDGKLDPRGLTTRAQAAQVLYNLLSQD
ncbi:S-layer homology domain-containing protein [Paenibacillus daejeonensis]|uniref:S-layer homology domain-containing protein n=1 Tax=Paenibacillus daejeonensis TaxID=135193 RepID=UPI00037AEF1F|nr:S-layer homology domain-containing protein [Paenibacillus daejeonensis]